MDIKLFIIKLLSAAYIVLDDIGITMSKPIAVNVNGEMKSVIKALTEDNSCVFTSNDKTTDILAELTNPSINPVVFYYDNTFKGDTRLEELLNVIKSGIYKGKKVVRLLIVLLDKVASEELLSQVLFTDYEVGEFYDFNIWDILPAGNDMSLVEDKISNLSRELGEEERFLKSGICFTYPYFRNQSKITEYNLLKCFAEKMIEYDSQVKDVSDLSTQFIDNLYKYRTKDKPLGFVELPDVNKNIDVRSTKYMFYDYKYIYMSNEFFYLIMDNIKHLIGPNRLKEILASEGILIKGAGKGYTSKMPCHDQYGRYRRFDFLKFDREQLKLPPRMDIIDHYGGMSYED